MGLLSEVARGAVGTALSFVPATHGVPTLQHTTSLVLVLHSIELMRLPSPICSLRKTKMILGPCTGVRSTALPAGPRVPKDSHLQPLHERQAFALTVLRACTHFRAAAPLTIGQPRAPSTTDAEGCIH